MSPLLDMIVDQVPPPEVDDTGPFQMQISSLDTQPTKESSVLAESPGAWLNVTNKSSYLTGWGRAQGQGDEYLSPQRPERVEAALPALATSSALRVSIKSTFRHVVRA